jgi:general secretion pathway protein D
MRALLHAGALSLLALATAGLPAAAQGPPLPETERKPVRMAGPSPAVFERLGALYGQRVKVDPELFARPVTLSLLPVNFEDALRVAASLAKAFWVVQPDGTVVISSDTPEKREALTPQLERTFALPGRSSDEVNEAVRLLREMLDMRRVRPDTRSGTFAVFDTPQRLAIAEQFLAQLPDDPGEVTVEVQILEIDRERALDLGLVTPDTAVAVHLGAGALVPSDIDSLLEVVRFLVEQGLLPTALISDELRAVLASGIIDPSQAAALLPGFIIAGGGGTSFAVHLPSTELRLRYLARTTRAWRRFTLRTLGGREGVLFIGERFPIVFTTFSAAFVPQIIQELINLGQFVPPVPAVRYEDIGTKITVTPQLHPGREITLNLKIDQSALAGPIINDIPVLSSRLLEQQVRLRSGETLIIAGLRRTDRVETLQATPGLGQIPLLGRLFRRPAPETRTTELLFLVTPHLTRLPATERLTARAFFLGTESDFAPIGPQPAAAPAPRQPAPRQPPAPRPAQPPPPGAPTPPLGPPAPPEQPQPEEPQPEQPEEPEQPEQPPPP